MVMYTNQDVREAYNMLVDLYPKACCMSRAVLFLTGLNDGKITNGLMERAKEYYGDLWNYTGD